jgi:hypothetical protein
MASTYSPALRIELIGTGDQSGTWGDTTNNNLGSLIEQAITGYQSVTMVDANYTLTTLNGSVDQARNAVIEMVSSGALSGTRSVIVPSSEKVYIVKNATTGGQSITVRTSGGTGITIANGKTALLYCNGTNVEEGQNYFSSLSLGTPLAIASGGTGQTSKTAAFDALAPTTTLGDIIYYSASNNVRLAGNTTATKNFLSQTGTGSASAAPAWAAITKADVGLSNVENTALSTWAGSTNLTTLGTVATGTWNATTIGASKGGTGQTTYSNGQLLIGKADGTLNKATITAGANISVTNGDGTITIAATGNVGVTSVGLSMPGQFTVTNSPVTGSGTLTAGWASQTSNYVLAAPNGASGTPTFRALVSTDIPTLNQNTTGTAAGLSSTLVVGSGGTGATTASDARTNLGVPSTTGTGASGTWGIDITGNAATATKLSTASGSAPSYSARAWVNFTSNTSNTTDFPGGASVVNRPNGTTTCTVTTTNNHTLLTGHWLYASTGVAAGLYQITVTGEKTFTFTTSASTSLNNVSITFACRPIRNSGNVSMVTYVSTGDQIVNFAVAMPNDTYGYSCSGRPPQHHYDDTTPQSAVSLRTQISDAAGAVSNGYSQATVTIFC